MLIGFIERCDSARFASPGQHAIATTSTAFLLHHTTSLHEVDLGEKTLILPLPSRSCCVLKNLELSGSFMMFAPHALEQRWDSGNCKCYNSKRSVKTTVANETVMGSGRRGWDCTFRISYLQSRTEGASSCPAKTANSIPPLSFRLKLWLKCRPLHEHLYNGAVPKTGT